jgi:hypothetical protein
MALELAMKNIPAVAVVLCALAVMNCQAQALPSALPWCVYVGDGTADCSYYTFRQCLVTARGHGSCARNPRFDGYYFERGLPAPVNVDPFARPLPQRGRERFPWGW